MTFVVLGILLFALVFGFINYYMGSRGYAYLKTLFPALRKKSYWIVFTLVVLGLFAGGYIPVAHQKSFSVISAYWLAVFMYMLLALVMIDGLRLLIKFTPLRKSTLAQGKKIRHVVALLLLGGLVTLLVYGSYNARTVNVNTYDVSVHKTAGRLESLQVVFLSDIHLGHIVDNKRLQGIVQKINALSPDVVLIGGDIIDDDLEPFIAQDMAGTLRNIRSRYGVYAVLGNHDGTFEHQAEVIRQFEKGGIEVLIDRAVMIEDAFYVIGRTDDGMPRGGPKKEALEHLVKALDQSLPMLVMDHNPADLSEARAQGVDLQFSGHTHGGQVFPFNWGTSLIFAQDWGYLASEGFQLIVSSGAGTWGPPMRIGTRSEIVHVTIDFTP